MRTASLLRRLFGDESEQLSKNERSLLEAILFSQTSKELENDFNDKQVNLGEAGLFRCLVSDLLTSGEYTLG